MADVVDITLVEFPGPLVLERFYATDASQCPLIHAHISSDTSFYCPTCAQTQRQIQVRKYTKLGSIQLGRLADNCQIFSVRQLSQNVGSIYPVQIYILLNAHSQNLRPKGA